MTDVYKFRIFYIGHYDNGFFFHRHRLGTDVHEHFSNSEGMEILCKNMLIFCMNGLILIDLALLFFNNNKLISILFSNSNVVR